MSMTERIEAFMRQSWPATDATQKDEEKNG